mgnify:CR=1 FL=1
MPDENAASPEIPGVTTPTTPATLTTVTTPTVPTWTEQLSADLKGNKELTKYEKISDLGKAFVELKGKTEGMVKIPGEKATPEELSAFRQAMGIPDKPEGYELKKPDKMPEGMQYDETLESKFKETANKLGLTQVQVKGIFEMFNGHEIDRYSFVDKFIKENREKAVSTLKDIWKGNAYEENRTKTTKTFFDTLQKLNPPKELGGMEGIKKAFDESGFGDNPAIVWYFSKLFDRMDIDSFGSSSPHGNAVQKPKGMLEFKMKTV